MDDLISRQAAIDALAEALKQVGVLDMEDVGLVLSALPLAQPEYRFDEWCHDCKEYDQEHHCCPRFNRVIREALKDAQPERKKGEWIEISSINHTYRCSECGRLLVNVADGRNNVSKHYPYCHCGADMRGER